VRGALHWLSALHYYQFDDAKFPVFTVAISILSRGRQLSPRSLQSDASGGRPDLGDRVQLQQVLLNLIMNGIEAMNGVTAGTRELTVSSMLAEPRCVLVAIKDTGTGRDPAVAECMFQPFFTTKSDGLGMGLAVCRSIVEAPRRALVGLAACAAWRRCPLHCSAVGRALAVHRRVHNAASSSASGPRIARPAEGEVMRHGRPVGVLYVDARRADCAIAAICRRVASASSLYASTLPGPVRRTISSMSQRRMPISHSS
jgi:hypothetical protein